MNRFWLVVGIMLLVTSVGLTTVSGTNRFEEAGPTLAEIEWHVRQSMALDILERLEEQMEKNTEAAGKFAGAYINNDGNPVVNVTESDILFEGIPNASIQIVKYSLEDLNFLYNKIKFLPAEMSNILHIHGVALSVTNNRVRVWMSPVSEEIVEKLSAIVDIEAIEIVERKLNITWDVESEALSADSYQTIIEPMDVGVLSMPYNRNRRGAADR